MTQTLDPPAVAPVPTSRNATHHYSRTAVLAVERVEAAEVVTSDALDEQLADVYRRTRMRPGMLESLVGIRERRWWPADTSFTDGAVAAARAALTAAGVEAGSVGLMVNSSLSRTWLEPATAALIHHEIGLPTSCQNFDLTNACLGFVNGIEVAASMIDAGMVDYALVVDAEDSRPVSESTIARLTADTSTARDVMAEFAALTLGSGAVAMVLGPADRHPGGHRVVAGVSRAGTEHHELCVGDNESMITDLKGLLDNGLDLSAALWEEAAETFDWADGMDRYVIHQVSQVHTDALCERLGIDQERVPRTFPEFGNIGPASVPFTLAGQVDTLQRGERVLLMGIGSGLNACCLELAW